MAIVLLPFGRETMLTVNGKTLLLLSLLLIFIQLGIVAGMFVLRRSKRAFIKRKCVDLHGSPTDKNFCPLVKNISNNFCKSAFPPHIRSDGSIVNTPSEKANLFGLLFSSYSTLHDSGIPPPTTSTLRLTMSELTYDRVYGIMKS